MKSPIRVVCEGCLRSVELGLGQRTPAESPCPYCGCRSTAGSSGSRRAMPRRAVPESPTGLARPTDAPRDDRLGRRPGRAGTLGSLGTLPAPRAAGRRRVRPGLPGVRSPARSRRGDQGPQAARPERSGDGAVLPRGPGRRPARPPQHRGRLRRRLRRGPMLGGLSARRAAGRSGGIATGSGWIRRRRRGSSATWPTRSTTPTAWASCIGTSSRATSSSTTAAGRA